MIEATSLPNRLVLTFSLAVLLAACTADAADAPRDSAVATSPDSVAGDEPAAAVPQPDSLLLTPDGWGPLRIGMTRAEVIGAAGDDANPDAVGGPEPERCDEFRPRAAADGVLVMLENGVLTRISVARNADIATPAGFTVGAAGADVVAAYDGRADVAPHKYLAPPARYITVWSAPADGKRRGIRYETDADDVVAFLRAGGPSIEYVEGCL